MSRPFLPDDFKRQRYTFCFAPDTAAVLKDVSEVVGVPQGRIVEQGATTELIRIMAADNKETIKQEYQMYAKNRQKQAKTDRARRLLAGMGR